MEDLGTDGNKMDLQEIVQEGVDWIDLTQDKDKQQPVTDLWVPQNVRACLTSLGTTTFSRGIQTSYYEYKNSY